MSRLDNGLSIGRAAAPRRAKLVCTLGPASARPRMVEGLIAAGMDVARLNFSHGTHDEHARAVSLVREAGARADREVAILQDLSGPKIRLGEVKVRSREGRELQPGDMISLVTDDSADTETSFSVSYPALPIEVAAGERILLADATLELAVEAVEDQRVLCKVVRGGFLRSHAGVNLPGITLSVPALTDKDEEDLAFGLGQGIDAVAMSFVQRAADIVMLRRRLESLGHANVPIVAKLERPQALDELEQILDASDAVMVARGDLGVELPPEQVPVLQKELIRAANETAKPVIVATQMLESMVRSARPTRAEASDVANAVLDGADAVMLSAETAVGAYPFEAASMAARIVVAAEVGVATFGRQRRRREDRSTAQAIPFAARSIADDDPRVKAVVCHTHTGTTAQMLAAERPRTPVYAFGSDQAVLRRLAFVWGITPIALDLPPTGEGRLEAMEAQMVNRRLLSPGDFVVVVATAGASVRSNMIVLREVQGAGGSDTRWEGD